MRYSILSGRSAIIELLEAAASSVPLGVMYDVKGRVRFGIRTEALAFIKKRYLDRRESFRGKIDSRSSGGRGSGRGL